MPFYRAGAAARKGRLEADSRGGNKRKNGKDKCNDNDKCKNKRRSFDFATLRSG
jgi:hypothetical protein